MDPNAALAALREAAEWIDSTDDEFVRSQLAVDMVALIDRLDDWLSRGGALPDAWKKR